MSDVNNGDVLRIAGTWVYDGTEEVTNVYHVLVTSGGNKEFADVIDDIQQYMDLMYAEMDVFLMTSMVTDRISVANVTQDLVFGTINWGLLANGGQAGDPTAAGVAVLAFARTLKPRVQIRKYFGVCGETNLTDGVWSGPLVTAAFTDMESHIESQAMTDGLTVTGVAWNRTLLTHTLATSVAVASEPVYQRRRRRGRGS